MALTKHVHVASVMPHVQYITGAVRPYPLPVGPEVIARRTIEAIEGDLHGAIRGAKVSAEMPPEVIARKAQRLATAMAQGLRPPPWMDRKLVQAARYLMVGQPFKITSAGRAAIVSSQAPSSLPAAQREGGAGAAFGDPRRTMSIHRGR